MSINKLKLELIDKNDNKIYQGYLVYGVNDNNDCHIRLTFDNRVIKNWGTDYFEILQKIRNEIYPVIPIINASLLDVYPSAMSRDMSNGTILYKERLGKQAEEKDQVDIFGAVKDVCLLSSPKQQQAHHQMWFKSLGVERYGIDESYILIEKASKYDYIYNKKEKNINKILNENYQYFLIYDKDNNQTYNIENLNDIDLFKKGKLSARWQNLDKFIEWYANNWMNKER